MSEQLLKVLGGMLLAYVILCAFMYFKQDHFVFFPQSISDERVQQLKTESGLEEITISTKDGKSLHGWLLLGSETDDIEKNIVIYFGGNAEEVSHLVEYFSGFSDWSFALVNYRGYGKSEGKPGEKNFFRDAVQIYDEIKERIDENDVNIVTMGRSIGAGVALHVAQNREVNGMILVSPYDRLVDVAKDAYPFLPVELLARHRFNVIEKAPDIEVPAYALVAMEDRTIRPIRSKKLLEALAGEVFLTEIDGEDHNSVAHTSEYDEFLKNSLQELSME